MSAHLDNLRCGIATNEVMVANERKLFDINDRRDGIHGFDALWLAFGILDMHDEQLAKRQAEFSAADDAEREQVRQRRERLRELIRLVTIDGKPVTP